MTDIRLNLLGSIDNMVSIISTNKYKGFYPFDVIYIANDSDASASNVESIVVFDVQFYLFV